MILFYHCEIHKVFSKIVIKVEYVSCCVISTEYLRYWIEGNKVSYDTGSVMTVCKQDKEGRRCWTEEPTPMVYRSASPSDSSFPPSSIRLLELVKPSQCMFLHRRSQTYISVHTSVQIRTHDLNIWKIVQSTHPEGGWGETVSQLVETMRYNPEGRGFDFRWCHWKFLLTSSFWPGVDSAFNRNE